MKREIEMQVTQGARRSFLSLLFASICGYTAAVSGQEKKPSQKTTPPSGTPYSGTSKKGNIEEALQMAINAALKSAGGATVKSSGPSSRFPGALAELPA